MSAVESVEITSAEVVQLSGVAEAVHTWSGPGEALLVLTQHGALLERPGGAERWQRLGRYVDGAEAEQIAHQRGYDQVGFDSSVTNYVPPGLTLVQPPEEEPVAAAAAAPVTPIANMSRAELVEAAAQRNRALAKVYKAEGMEALERAVEEWAARHDMPASSVRTGLATYYRKRKRKSPWQERHVAELRMMATHYVEMERRQAAGELLKDVAEEVAQQTGRKVGGVLQTYNVWRNSQRKAPVAGAAPGAQGSRSEPPASAAPVAAPTTAEVRSLLGVQAVRAENGSDAVSQVREGLEGLSDGLLATWRAIPTARKILEAEVEALLARLDELEAEAKRVQQVAELLGVDLS